MFEESCILDNITKGRQHKKLHVVISNNKQIEKNENVSQTEVSIAESLSSSCILCCREDCGGYGHSRQEMALLLLGSYFNARDMRAAVMDTWLEGEH